MEDKLEKLKKKSDLSDIILEKDKPDPERIKKLLLGAASLVLLVLIVLIIVKMFSNSNVSPSESLASVGDGIKEQKEQISDAIVSDTKDALFKEEPIIDESSETDLKFEEMVRKLKLQDEQENQEPTVNNIDKDIDTAAKDIEKTINKEKDSLSVVDKIKEVTKDITPVVKPVVVPEPKEVIISTKKVASPTPSPISHLSGYFIQVGATSKSFPDARFLTKIKNSGYDYIVHKVTIKGRDIKKVLVGPYTTRDQARENLNDIQSKINPSAYIYRIK